MKSRERRYLDRSAPCSFTITVLAPKRLASSSLAREVVSTVTSAPIAEAILTAM